MLMYYFLVALLILLVFYALTKLFSSLLKGCVSVILLIIVIGIVYTYTMADKNPINIFDFNTVEDFKN